MIISGVRTDGSNLCLGKGVHCSSASPSAGLLPLQRDKKMRNHLKQSLLHANWNTVVSESPLGLWVLSSHASYPLVLPWQTVWEECKWWHSRSHPRRCPHSQRRGFEAQPCCCSPLLSLLSPRLQVCLTGAESFPALQEEQGVCHKPLASRTLMHQRFLCLVFFGQPKCNPYFQT